MLFTSRKEDYFKRKEFAPKGSKFFSFKVDLFTKRGVGKEQEVRICIHCKRNGIKSTRYIPSPKFNTKFCLLCGILFFFFIYLFFFIFFFKFIYFFCANSERSGLRSILIGSLSSSIPSTVPSDSTKLNAQQRSWSDSMNVHADKGLRLR